MISKEQLRAGRALVGWSAAKLAEEAGIGLATVQRMESRGPEGSNEETVAAVKAALVAAGVVFVDPNGLGPGVRIKSHKYGA